MTGQCLAFRLHLAGLLLHGRENRGDFFHVQIGCDSGVTGRSEGRIGQKPHKPLKSLVRVGRLELPRPLGQQILSVMRVFSADCC